MTCDYFINGRKAKKAVTVIERQGFVKPGLKRDPEKDVYAFNESLQVCKEIKTNIEEYTSIGRDLGVVAQNYST